MSTTTSISFYDILNYGVIGAFIFSLCTTNPEPISFNTNFFFLIFFLGFVYSKICEATLGRFIRMNEKMLKQSAHSDTHEISKDYSYIYNKQLSEYVKSTIILLEASLAFIRNLWPLSIAATIAIGFYDKSHVAAGSQFVLSILIWIITTLMLTYITANLIKNHKYKLLALLAFFLTIILVCIYCVGSFGNIRIYGYDFALESLFYFFCLMDIVLPFLWYQNQMKIFHLVFDLNRDTPNE